MTLHFFTLLEVVFPVNVFFSAVFVRMVAGLTAVPILGFNSASDRALISLLLSVT